MRVVVDLAIEKDQPFFPARTGPASRKPARWVEADLENGMYSTSGGLTTTYSGALPSGYSPMHEEADILLGTGGDNSNGASGEFFEGAVTSGYPSDGTENASRPS